MPSELNPEDGNEIPGLRPGFISGADYFSRDLPVAPGWVTKRPWTATEAVSRVAVLLRRANADGRSRVLFQTKRPRNRLAASSPRLSDGLRWDITARRNVDWNYHRSGWRSLQSDGARKAGQPVSPRDVCAAFRQNTRPSAELCSAGHRAAPCRGFIYPDEGRVP